MLADANRLPHPYLVGLVWPVMIEWLEVVS